MMQVESPLCRVYHAQLQELFKSFAERDTALYKQVGQTHTEPEQEKSLGGYQGQYLSC